jgi:hypothetical protein
MTEKLPTKKKYLCDKDYVQVIAKKADTGQNSGELRGYK